MMTTLVMTSLLANSGNWTRYGAGWMAVMMIPMALSCIAMMLGHMRHGGGHREAGEDENAETILDRRFAEGDLSPHDYENRRDALTGTTAPHPEEAISSGGRQRSRR